MIKQFILNPPNHINEKLTFRNQIRFCEYGSLQQMRSLKDIKQAVISRLSLFGWGIRGFNLNLAVIWYSVKFKVSLRDTLVWICELIGNVCR